MKHTAILIFSALAASLAIVAAGAEPVDPDLPGRSLDAGAELGEILIMEQEARGLGVISKGHVARDVPFFVAGNDPGRVAISIRNLFFDGIHDEQLERNAGHGKTRLAIHGAGIFLIERLKLRAGGKRGPQKSHGQDQEQTKCGPVRRSFHVNPPERSFSLSSVPPLGAKAKPLWASQSYLGLPAGVKNLG